MSFKTRLLPPFTLNIIYLDYFSRLILSITWYLKDTEQHKSEFSILPFLFQFFSCKGYKIHKKNTIQKSCLSFPHLFVAENSLLFHNRLAICVALFQSVLHSTHVPDATENKRLQRVNSEILPMPRYAICSTNLTVSKS